MKMLSIIARCCILAVLIAPCAGCSGLFERESVVPEDLRAESITALRGVMDSQERWAKVHAAECLLELGYPQGVAEVFRRELAAHGDEPEYRIGIWRVLARDSRHNRDHSQWIDRIKRAFLDEGAPDRTYAAETLATLGVSLTPDELRRVAKESESADPRLAANCVWLLAIADKSNRETHHSNLVELLNSPEVGSRSVVANALRHLGPLDRTLWDEVVDRAEREPDPFTKRRLYGAALVAAPATADKEELDAIRAQLMQIASSGDVRVDDELPRVLADVGQASDLPALIASLRAGASLAQGTTTGPATADLSAAAANAILRIDRRQNRHAIHWLDWAVIAAYALAQMWVGLFYSSRVKDREDYLLGSRSMRPWMVGLSLFATMMSTISYLMFPGELIRYGPLVFCVVFAMPFVYFVVGWWLIPPLMAFSGVSGYALLEKRLGVGVRLLGASVFLLLRVVWMATIIHATATIALLPALGVDPAYSPLICAILGCVTLGYTAMGGLRAVVMTDVIQSFILFGGAIVVVLMVTLHFGGLQWFPTSWPSHWQSLNFGLGFQERITVSSAMIFMLAWYICTCGSDQMAIQRFIATRDAAAARRSFGIMLTADVLVKAFLVLVGLAVMAYFLDQPHRLPDRTGVLTHSDKMFPTFIVVSVPIGLTGLIISGIMAAAMSSLSSGISSSAAVISDDFIKRFRGMPAGDHASLTEERWISAAIGTVVVALSLVIKYMPGNLFEVTSRLVNALVAPLFILFFMAIFVPWATSFGTVVGFVVSAAVAISIAFFYVFNISMMWIIPLAMLAGILAGCLGSLIPTGRPGRRQSLPGDRP